MINQFIKYIINFYSSPSYFKNYFRILYKYIDIYFNFFNNFLIKRYNIHQIFRSILQILQNQKTQKDNLKNDESFPKFLQSREVSRNEMNESFLQQKEKKKKETQIRSMTFLVTKDRLHENGVDVLRGLREINFPAF